MYIYVRLVYSNCQCNITIYQYIGCIHIYNGEKYDVCIRNNCYNMLRY